MPRILTLLFFCMLSLCCRADGLEWDAYSWDFGTIQEKDGIVTHTFVMTNATKKDVQITSAIPSCSCTLVNFPKGVIRPGQKAEVEVQYSPSGAAGKVFRDIQVYDYDNRCIAMLEITAEVEPIDRSIPERYPFTLAPFLYTNLHKVPFGYVYHGTDKTKIVYLANASDKPMNISFINPDEKLKLKYPATLQPGEEAELQMTFLSPRQADYYEFVQDTLKLLVDGLPSLMPVEVSMVALAKLDATGATPSLRTYPSSPRLRKKGKVFRAQVEIYNDGEADLSILAVQLPPTVKANVQRGETVGKGRKYLLELAGSTQEDFTLCLFTNDPVRPMKEIRITGLPK